MGPLRIKKKSLGTTGLRWRNFMLCLNSDRKDAPSIYVSHGSVLFLLGLKSKKKLLSTAVLFHCRTTSCSLDQQPLSSSNKNELPALQKSNVIYQFSCHCHRRFVGRTSQKLPDRMKQHVPKSIRSSFQERILPACQSKYSTQSNIQALAFDSAVELHLVQSRFLFHLSATEPSFTKTSNPALCRPQELLYSLKIVHQWHSLIGLFSSQSRLGFSYE